MLTVDHYELIRRKVLIDGKSQRAASRELGHSRKTVKKALKNPVPPGYRRLEPRPKPVIEPVKGIIEAWLEEDKQRPPKQRHTAYRIYERLRDEYDFLGNPSTVRRYVAEVNGRGKEAFFPLSFDPGEEAQVDWHEGWVYENGELVKKQFFCMRLCYSKAEFVCSYNKANLESFLDGHIRAFLYFGGVPKRIAYDNLKSAVTKVGKGRERKLNKKFREFRSWYLFDSRFCNIARGNEKGDVENLAKRSQRTYLTPVPHITSLDQLRDDLVAQCKKSLDLPGPRPYTDKSRCELLDEEKGFFLPLPPKQFEACRQVSTIADKYSLVRLDTNSYSVPVRWAHHPCVVKGYVDKVEIFADHQLLATHRRSYRKDQFILEPEHYISLLERKPGGLHNALAFKGNPWGKDMDIMRKELEYRDPEGGTRRFIDILLMTQQGYSLSEVVNAVSICVKRRSFNSDSVLHTLGNDPIERRSPNHLDLSEHPELASVIGGIRSLSIYDSLYQKEAAL